MSGRETNDVHGGEAMEARWGRLSTAVTNRSIDSESDAISLRGQFPVGLPPSLRIDFH